MAKDRISEMPIEKRQELLDDIWTIVDTIMNDDTIVDHMNIDIEKYAKSIGNKWKEYFKDK